MNFINRIALLSKGRAPAYSRALSHTYVNKIIQYRSSHLYCSRWKTAYLCSERSELWKVFVVVVVEGSHVLAVADEPINGGKVFALGQLLIETPEDLDDTQGCRRYRVGKVTARGRDPNQQNREYLVLNFKLSAHCH